VLGANRQASDTLARLRGTNPASSAAGDARVAVRRAQQSVTLATGAVRALNAPASSDQLARDARQVLDRESAYYQEVVRVLNHPASTSTANVSDLAANLPSALSVAGPTVAGTSPTVQGSDRLVGWARTIRIKAQRAKARRDRGGASRAPSGSASGTSTRTTTTPPVTAARGPDCGGVFAGPNTSCSFASNVRWAGAGLVWSRGSPTSRHGGRTQPPVTGCHAAIYGSGGRVATLDPWSTQCAGRGERSRCESRHLGSLAATSVGANALRIVRRAPAKEAR
jgi:hypothetical protein